MMPMPQAVSRRMSRRRRDFSIVGILHYSLVMNSSRLSKALLTAAQAAASASLKPAAVSAG